MASKNFKAADGFEALKRLKTGAGTGGDSKEGIKHKERFAGEDFTGFLVGASMRFLATKRWFEFAL